MALSVDIIKLIILLIPGFIGLIFLKSLIKYHDKAVHIFLLELTTLSIFSYVIWYIVSKGISNIDMASVQILKTTKDSSIIVNFREVLGATAISIILSGIFSLCHMHKIINRIGRKIQITKRFGDEEVWDFYFNSLPIEDCWITVRDARKNLMYYGFVNIFSDWGPRRELVLTMVDVYEQDSESGEWTLSYSPESLYLCREPNELDIEVQKPV